MDRKSFLEIPAFNLGLRARATTGSYRPTSFSVFYSVIVLCVLLWILVSAVLVHSAEC